MFAENRIRVIGLVFLFVATTFYSPSCAKNTGNCIFQLPRSNDPADQLHAYYYIEGVLDMEDLYFTVEVFSSVAECLLPSEFLEQLT